MPDNEVLMIPLCEVDTDVIKQLDDEPNDVGGLTAAELKAAFDAAGDGLKDYLNETLIPQIIAADATEQARAGAESVRETQEATRQANEATRQSNETTRQTQEAAREAAEAARANENSGIVAQATAQAERAGQAADSADDSAAAAGDSASAAATSESNAARSEQIASAAADSAARNEQAAGLHARGAQVLAQSAADAAIEAESYARGQTGSRAGENTDNAKYYKDQSKDIYDDVNERFQIGLDNGLLCAKTVSLTLLSSGWTESLDEPFSWVQTLTLSAADAMAEAQAGVAYLPGSATKAQWTEAERCGLRVSGQTTTSVTITAGIAKPNINIPIELALYIKPESMSAVYATQEDLEDLNAYDVGAVPTTEKGAQNGVATLGSDGKIPEIQIPVLRYIPPSARGAVNGVASLDGNGKVPVAQIPDMGHVPNTRKVNGKALNADVTLSASDVGARANTWKPGVSELAAGFILPLSMGGTGANSKAGAKAALEIPDLPLSVANGGTGAVTAAKARENLGIPDLTGIVKMKTVSGSAETYVYNGNGYYSVRTSRPATISVPTDAIVYLRLTASASREGGGYTYTEKLDRNLIIDMTQKQQIVEGDIGDSQGLVSVSDGTITLSGQIIWSDKDAGYIRNYTPLTYFVKYLTKE